MMSEWRFPAKFHILLQNIQDKQLHLSGIDNMGKTIGFSHFILRNGHTGSAEIFHKIRPEADVQHGKFQFNPAC